MAGKNWTYQLASIKIPVELFPNYLCDIIHNFIRKCTLVSYITNASNDVLITITALQRSEGEQKLNYTNLKERKWKRTNNYAKLYYQKHKYVTQASVR